jgi:hypothetical protein
MSKKKRRKQWRRTDWQKIIQRWQKSGLSVREYCRRHEIPETSFYLDSHKFTLGNFLVNTLIRE